MTHGFSLHPDELKKSASTLSDLGDKLGQGGEKLTSVGENVSAHTKGDSSGIGSAIGKVVGRATETIGQVFKEGGRVAGTAGKHIDNNANAHRVNEDKVKSSIESIDKARSGPPPIKPKPQGIAPRPKPAGAAGKVPPPPIKPKPQGLTLRPQGTGAPGKVPPPIKPKPQGIGVNKPGTSAPASVHKPPTAPKPETTTPSSTPTTGGKPGTVPPELENLLHGKNVDELVANGTLKPLKGGVTKRVYKVNGHDYVLSTANGANAQQALKAEVGTLGKYHDAGLPTAAHGKMSNGDTVFPMNQGGKTVDAAVQPFQHGQVAQLVTRQPPNATEVIGNTVNGWKTDWKATQGTPGHAQATADYNDKLNNLHGDLSKIDGHYQNNNMYDLQFFVNKQNGHATLFDPGDPENSQVPTGADKNTVSSWTNKLTGPDLTNLNKYRGRTGL